MARFFFYGILLDLRTLGVLTSPQLVRTAWAPGWRLGFDGVALMLPGDRHDRVFGALYDIPDRDVPLLDRYEGVFGDALDRYRREPVFTSWRGVRPMGGVFDFGRAWAYVSADPHFVGSAPFDGYLHRVRDAYAAHEAPAEAYVRLSEAAGEHQEGSRHQVCDSSVPSGTEQARASVHTVGDRPAVVLRTGRHI